MKNSACFQDAHLSLVVISTKQVLISDYDIAQSKEAVESSKMFVKEMAPLASRSRVDS